MGRRVAIGIQNYRPRRFGKTLTMSMTEQFFSLKYADRGDLFEGLSIWKEEKFRNLQGRYRITSNRESGFGRYDIVLEPVLNQEDAIIIEFKVRNPRKENSLEETLQNALQQITDKKYETELITKGIAAERIRKYGFVFEGKKVLIG